MSPVRCRTPTGGTWRVTSGDSVVDTESFCRLCTGVEGQCGIPVLDMAYVFFFIAFYMCPLIFFFFGQLIGMSTHLDRGTSTGCLDAGAVVELAATPMQLCVGVHISVRKSKPSDQDFLGPIVSDFSQKSFNG
jgi:hypothetical protein